jgi:CheY-like chemotaxis protein
MNGYEVAARMRPKLGKAQLIALTGYGQTEDIRRATEAGFDAHLIKPVDFDELQRIIAEFGLKPKEETAV